MSPADERLPEGVVEDRRKRVDRRRLHQLEIHRVLGVTASAARPGFVTIRAVGHESSPAQVTLPVEAAMTLLNDLQRVANEDRWFDLDETGS